MVMAAVLANVSVYERYFESSDILSDFIKPFCRTFYVPYRTCPSFLNIQLIYK